MRPIAKYEKRQVRNTESSHIVNTTIRLPCNAVIQGVKNTHRTTNSGTKEFFGDTFNVFLLSGCFTNTVVIS